MFHKLFLTSLVAFFPRDAQLPVAFTMVLLYGGIILLVKPYKRKGDDTLHLFVQCELFLALYAGHLFYKKIDASETLDVVMSAVLITITCLLILYFLSQIIWALKKKYIVWKQQKKAREDAESGRKPAKAPSGQGSMTLQRSQPRLVDKKTLGHISANDQIHFERNPLAHGTDDGPSNFVANPLFGASTMINPLATPHPALAMAAGAPASPPKAKRGSILAQPSLDNEGKWKS